MLFYQLTLTIYLKTDMGYKQSPELIGKFLSKAMLKNENLMEFHKSSGYKYVYDNFYPIEEDGVYKKGRIYVLHLRTFNKEFVSRMKPLLNTENDENMKVIAVEEKQIKQRHICELYSMNPVIVTVDSKPWLKYDGDILLLQRRLQENLQKKYESITGEKLSCTSNFIQTIEILNKVPYAYDYKGIKLLANKIKIQVNDDADSQTLAFIAAGMGLGEKGSILGAGYVHAKYL